MNLQELKKHTSNGAQITLINYYENLEASLECSLRGTFDPATDILLAEMKVGPYTFREVQMTGPLDGGQDTFYEIL